MTDFAIALNELRDEIHELNKKWWVDLDTGEPIERNFGELMALAHSELSEALEGKRKNLMDDHLPTRPMAEVEIADCIIRLLDTAAGLNYDIGGALVEKLKYNAVRKDHTLEHRRTANGKKF